MPHWDYALKNYSTNVRFNDLRRHLSLALITALWRIAPTLTERTLKKVFFRPTPHPLPLEAEKWLQKGRPFRINVGETAIQGWEWGQGPSVLFVHGWNGRGGHFHAFFQPLLDAGFSVIAFDAPGHGQSQGETSSYFEITDTVRTLLRTGREPAGVVGHSLGASAVVNALSKETATPAVVLIAPALDLQKILYTAFDGFGIPKKIYIKLIGDFEERFGYRMDLDNPNRLLPGLGMPVLIIHDPGDPTTAYLDSRRMAEKGDHVRLLTTEGLGHKRILTDISVVQAVVDHLSLQSSMAGSRQAQAGNRTVFP